MSSTGEVRLPTGSLNGLVSIVDIWLICFLSTGSGFAVCFSVLSVWLGFLFFILLSISDLRSSRFLLVSRFLFESESAFGV
jgi:hypothetical protein